MPEKDNARYGEAMHEFIKLIRRVNADYGGRIQALCFYEWRDNRYHGKIWNVEQSPIHVAFGLCDRSGVPKFNIKELVNYSLSSRWMPPACWGEESGVATSKFLVAK